MKLRVCVEVCLERMIFSPLPYTEGSVEEGWWQLSICHRGDQRDCGCSSVSFLTASFQRLGHVLILAFLTSNLYYVTCYCYSKVIPHLTILLYHHCGSLHNVCFTFKLLCQLKLQNYNIINIYNTKYFTFTINNVININSIVYFWTSESTQKTTILKFLALVNLFQQTSNRSKKEKVESRDQIWLVFL